MNRARGPSVDINSNVRPILPNDQHFDSCPARDHNLNEFQKAACCCWPAWYWAEQRPISRHNEKTPPPQRCWPDNIHSKRAAGDRVRLINNNLTRQIIQNHRFPIMLRWSFIWRGVSIVKCNTLLTQEEWTQCKRGGGGHIRWANTVWIGPLFVRTPSRLLLVQRNTCPRLINRSFSDKHPKMWIFGLLVLLFLVDCILEW